jgi:hypothetical protein
VAYPNPSRGRVQFAWQETEADSVRIDIYDLAGDRVGQVRASGAGIRSAAWSTQDLAPGVYLYQVVLSVHGTEIRKGIHKLAVVK